MRIALDNVRRRITFSMHHVKIIHCSVQYHEVYFLFEAHDI